MAHPKPVIPRGHGEVLTRPAFKEWTTLAEENAAQLSSEDTLVGGMPFARLRALARRQALAEATAFSRRLKVEVSDTPIDPERIVCTGHQPDLYHPGVWVKDFLLQRFADETGATAIDLVVDTDVFDTVSLTVPCVYPVVQRCEQTLAQGGARTCYATAPVPSAREIEEFCAAGARAVSSLPTPAIARHFGEFARVLREAANDATNMSELVTFARRRYEASAGSTYVELPVTALSRTEAFCRFVAHILLDAKRFVSLYNQELKLYRTVSSTRSSAHPLPDLACTDREIEVPFWLIDGQTRQPLSVRNDAKTVTLKSGSRVIMELSRDVEEVASALAREVLIVPRVVTLTMFARLFLGDLFIHGVGGSRYDVVTDGVIERYFRISPPHYALASMTMYLPLGAHVVTEKEVASVRHRLHRLKYNPDTMLNEIEFDSALERMRAIELAKEKARLIEAITAVGADKKELGNRIRRVNDELFALLGPLYEKLRDELAICEGQRADSEILTDRTYPFCLWNPLEIQDKVR